MSRLTGLRSSAAFAALFLALLASGTSLLADESPNTAENRLTIRLDPKSRLLTGRLETEVVCPEQGDTWYVVLYPRRFSSRSSELSDVDFPFRFPGSFSPGDMIVEKASVRGLPAAIMPDPENPVLARLSASACNDSRGMPVELSLDFSVQIPNRFGPFGAVEGAVTLTAGWYPLIVDAPSAQQLAAKIEQGSRFLLDITVTAPGILVAGTTPMRVTPNQVLHLDQYFPGPLALFFRPDSTLTVIRKQETIVGNIVSRSGTYPSRKSRTRRVVALMNKVVQDDAFTAPDHQPFLLLETPLRESMAFPLPGGALYSDMLFSITPAKRFLQQHDSNLLDALNAGLLMTGQQVGLVDALVTVSILKLYRWEKGESRPDFIRQLLRKGEVVQELDKVATDPQIFFQSALFFSPEVAGDVLLSLQGTVAPVPSPLTVARGIAITHDWTWLLARVRQAISRRTSLLTVLSNQDNERNRQIVRDLLATGPVDLELVSVSRGANSWEATVCKRDSAANLPVEMLSTAGARRTWLMVDGPYQCLVATLPDSPRKPDVLLDPFGLFLQRTQDDSHPRRNDRNYADRKWMLSRPYISMSTGDRLPTAGVELRVQPRWDLHNVGFLLPEITPSRAVLTAGWRYSFGRKVRPSFLANQLGIGLRATQDIDGWGNTFGPSLTFVRYTRQSRTNPFEGSWINAFVYPVVSFDGGKTGARFGGAASQLFGRSPDHILAIRAFADGAAGWLPEWEAPTSGGYRGVRALATAEVMTRNRVGGSLEYRLMLDRNWNFSVLDLAWLHGLQAAFFVDSASHADRPGHLFAGDNTYTGAGIGLRTIFQGLGIIPAILTVDFSYLIPTGHDLPQRLGATVTFFQPF